MASTKRNYFHVSPVFSSNLFQLLSYLLILLILEIPYFWIYSQTHLPYFSILLNSGLRTSKRNLPCFVVYSKRSLPWFVIYQIPPSPLIFQSPPTTNMSLPTAQAILSRHEDLMEWDQPLLFPAAHGIINLAPAIGPKAHTPDGARNQPSQYPRFRYTKHTIHCRFDPDTYKGKDSLETLLKDVRSS